MYFLRSGIPYVRFLIVFILGISSGIMPRLYTSLWLLIGVVTIYTTLTFIEKKYRGAIMYRSIFAYAGLFLLGICLVSLKNERSNFTHYFSNMDSIQYYKAKISSIPENKEKTLKIILEVSAIKTKSGWTVSNGKILAYLPKENYRDIAKGTVLLISGKPLVPSEPPNPKQFDYKEYLERQNIYAIHYIKNNSFEFVGYEKENWIIQISDSFRNYCEEKLKNSIKGENEFRIATALLLGMKTEIDEKLLEAYSDTGTIHALAVSGMHVSLIYFMVVFIFGFLKRLKNGRIIFTILSLSVFWFYAMVTGFSPSVVRAVTMFSVVLIAGLIRRNTGVYNTLAFSAFVILCVEPMWLWDIGFQFSFMAVVGIAYIFPILSQWWTPSNKILENIWSLMCISTSAQLSVAPLSIYYFHTFPLLFLPFNIIIVPISSLAMYTGIAGLITVLIDFISVLFLGLTDYILRLMNFLVFLPTNSNLLKIEFLYLYWYEVFLCYLFLFCFFASIKNKHVKGVKISILVYILLIVSLCYHSIEKYNIKTFALYSIKGKMVFSLTKNHEAVFYSDSLLTLEDKSIKNSVSNHLASLGINKFSSKKISDSSGKNIKQFSFGQILVWEGLKILRLEKYNKEIMVDKFLNAFDVIIVSDKKVIDFLKEVNLKPKILIDSSVKGYSIKDLDGLYDTRVEGAYVKEIF